MLRTAHMALLFPSTQRMEKPGYPWRVYPTRQMSRASSSPCPAIELTLARAAGEPFLEASASRNSAAAPQDRNLIFMCLTRQLHTPCMPRSFSVVVSNSISMQQQRVFLAFSSHWPNALTGQVHQLSFRRKCGH